MLGAAIGLTVLLVLPFRFVRPPTSSFIVRDATPAEQTVSREWVPLDQLGDALPIAVVAAEDQKFPVHHGFDFVEIGSALREGDRGASTLTQQVAKNLYLWPGRSWLRKALEAWLTIFLELLWPKARILEVYLNLCEFGPGVFGAAAASRTFFGVAPNDLDAVRAARLAAVLPAPKERSAVDPSPAVLERARAIERQVKQLGGARFLDALEER